MLYVFVGNDPVAVRKEAHAFLEKHHPDLRYEVCTEETYVSGMISEYAYGQSLFGADAPVLFDTLLGNEDIWNAFIPRLDALNASRRTFVVLDEMLPSAIAKTLKGHSTAYTAIAAENEKERFNTFLLADAFVRKDKKSLWVLFMRAKIAGISGEEIAGTLFWQVKSARLALMTKSSDEAGMKSFPYTKAKQASKYYSLEELHHHSESLIRLYHEGHAGKDMDRALERFVLTL